MAVRTGQQDSGRLDSGAPARVETPRQAAATSDVRRTAWSLVSYILLVTLIIAAASGGLVWVMGRSQPRTVEIIIPTPSPLLVHVDGLVRNPGVYELPPGSRVQDAIEAAGGLTAGSTVNLAAPLYDGQSIVAGSAVSAPVSGAPGDAPGAASGRIDLNTATSEQLQQLPGIGPARAAAIIEFRERNGPVMFADDLLAVSGIGPATVEDLRPLVTQQ